MATKKGSKRSKVHLSSSSKAKPDPELSSEDQIIAELLTRVVRAEVIPREIRHLWRQPYNAIALMLRSKARDQDMTTDDPGIAKLVEEWVIEDRRKTALRSQGTRA